MTSYTSADRIIGRWIPRRCWLGFWHRHRKVDHLTVCDVRAQYWK